MSIEIQLLLPGSYRAIAAKPEQVESTYNKDDKTWKLSFRLKKGLYATTMINEMTYCGCKYFANLPFFDKSAELIANFPYNEFRKEERGLNPCKTILT